MEATEYGLSVQNTEYQLPPHEAPDGRCQETDPRR